MDRFRRLFFSSFGVMCVAVVGCMNVPFYIPEVNTIPPVNLGGASDDVHIFRVDVTERMTVEPGAAYAQGGPKAVESYELTEVPADTPGTTPRQVGITCRQGWRFVGVYKYNSECLSHTIALRLYRPGFETIEVKCGHVPRDVEWTAAADLDAQEKALDDLLGVELLETHDSLPGFLSVKRNLEAGTTSDGQRAALRFCAGEYERLARRAARSADDPTTRGRLLAKASRLKSLAAGKHEDHPAR